jgi:glycine betaine/proline transport system ATP-binding protein
MRPVAADDSLDGPQFPAETLIRDALHVAAATDKPIRVIEHGVLAGLVDRAQILEAVAGRDEVAAAKDSDSVDSAASADVSEPGGASAE